MTVRKATLEPSSYFSLSNDEMVICHVKCGECMGERQVFDHGPTALSGANMDCKECLGIGYVEVSVPGSVFVKSVASQVLAPLIAALKSDGRMETRNMLAELGDMIEKARVKQIVED